MGFFSLGYEWILTTPLFPPSVHSSLRLRSHSLSRMETRVDGTTQLGSGAGLLFSPTFFFFFAEQGSLRHVDDILLYLPEQNECRWGSKGLLAWMDPILWTCWHFEFGTVHRTCLPFLSLLSQWVYLLYIRCWMEEDRTYGGEGTGKREKGRVESVRTEARDAHIGDST